MSSRFDPDTVATISRIRKLVKTHGVNKTAEIVGRTAANISQINKGQRHRHTGVLTINSLNLKKLQRPLTCRCCMNPTILMTKALLCVQCTVLELHKQGLVLIEEENLAPKPPRNRRTKEEIVR